MKIITNYEVKIENSDRTLYEVDWNGELQLCTYIKQEQLKDRIRLVYINRDGTIEIYVDVSFDGVRMYDKYPPFTTIEKAKDYRLSILNNRIAEMEKVLKDDRDIVLKIKSKYEKYHNLSSANLCDKGGVSK